MTIFFSLDGCRCKNSLVPFTVYAKPDEQTAFVTWPEPEVSCLNYVRKEVNQDRTPSAKFGLGKHEITYSFWYKVDDKRETEIKCFINFNVARK